MLSLSQQFSLDLVLTQLDDFSIIRSDLENIFLIVFMIPALVLQTLSFSAPAFYTKEKVQVGLFLFYVSASLVFSSILVFSGFMLLYSEYSAQLLRLNLGTSTEILLDFKKVFVFLLVLVKPALFFFLPLNFFVVFVLNCGLLRYNLIKWGVSSFMIADFVGCFAVENSVQLVLLLIQLFQLEFLFVLSLTTLNINVKSLFYRRSSK